MSLWTFLESVATATAAQVTELKSATALGGKFNLEEVKRRSYRSPAVFVTVTDTDEHDEGGATMVDVVMVLVVKSSSAVERSEHAMGIASKLLAWLPAEDFDDHQAKAGVVKLRSKNLYGAKADGVGVHLWGFRWKQRLQLNEDEVLPDANIVTDYQLPPSDDVVKIDEIELNP